MFRSAKTEPMEKQMTSLMRILTEMIATIIFASRSDGAGGKTINHRANLSCHRF
jgi:hypothetical protein